MSWNYYGLDHKAQSLVLKAKQRDLEVTQEGKKSLNQAFKMREAVAYGLERFWGEYLRLQKKEPNKSTYWKEVWDTLVEIMKQAQVTVPNDSISKDKKKAVADIEKMSQKFWGDVALDDKDTKFTKENQRVTLAVLTQLCDCLVWWTQRFKDV